ncbi:MAG: DNA polymerase I [Candidatus Omnitrophota bacterium]
MGNAKLCLIDANSLFYRAFFAIKAQLATSSGQPTNAVFGFVKMVNRILEEVNPEYLAVCFDVGRQTERAKKFAQYKMNRPSMPEALLSQVPLIKDVVRAYGFAIFEMEGHEADDIIASLAVQADSKIKKIVIVSSDKDILQLVSEKVEVYNPYKEDGIVYTQETVKEKFGVSPKKIKDLISLMGDASDNIPGARGIGEKTAVRLLSEFKDLDHLIENRPKIKRQAWRNAIEENIDIILLSRDLASLREDLPLEIDLEALKVRPAETDALWEVFSRLEFKGMLKILSQERLSTKKAGIDVPKKRASSFAKILEEVQRRRKFAFFIHECDPEQGILRVNIAFDEDGIYEIDDQKDLELLFALPDVLVIGHDIKRSRHIFARHGLANSWRCFDVMIAAYLLESSRAALELEALLWDYLKLKGVSRLDFISKESHFLVRLHEELGRRLDEKKLMGLFQDVEMPLVGVLAEMEEVGMALDSKLLSRLSLELDQKLERLIKDIYDGAGAQFNINSPKQLSEVLFQRLKLRIVKKTKTGASTDEEVLTKLSREHHLPRLLLEYRQIAKLKTTYIDALPALVSPETGKIHTSFNQTGTETGRLSSSNPNLQNIPVKTEMGRKIRQAFVPSRGFNVMLSADYSQIELRILAHLSKDVTLIKAFQKDSDIHRHTASLIFGVQERDVTNEMRENAKRVNFGIVYGMSPYGLAKDLGIDPKTAGTFIDEYFLRYPGVKSYLDNQIEFVRKNGYAVTLLGRRRVIPEINNTNMGLRQFAERQAINAPIQGSAADLIKVAMVAIDRGIKKQNYKTRMILQVHDELVFEVPDQEVNSLSAFVRQHMEGVISLSVPIQVTIRVGQNWLEGKAI